MKNNSSVKEQGEEFHKEKNQSLKMVVYCRKKKFMTIERINNEIVIRMPGNIDIEELQRLINLLIYKEVTVSSKASQEEVNKLASEVNKNWWEKNKSRFLK